MIKLLLNRYESYNLILLKNFQVSPLKEELEYYIESNLEDDFMENEELYDEFDFSSAPETDSDSSSSDDEPGTFKIF